MSLESTAHAIFSAIQNGDPDQAVTLVKEDPSSATALNGDGVGPVSAALYSFNRDLAERLVQAGLKPNFFEACALGYIQPMIAFLTSGADVNGFSPDGFTPLTLAAAFGGPDAVRLLVDQGADPEQRAHHASIKVVPLHAAVFGNRTDVVRALLEKGANPNSKQPGGFTALHGAAQNGNTEMARILVEAGADPQSKTDEGETPADLAREGGHGDLVAHLG